MGNKQSTETNYVQFALVGSTGCGKTTFFNAIRRITADEADGHAAASVDTSSASEPTDDTEYDDRKNRMRFCDLPGYSEQDYPSPDSYWDRFELDKFDGFLILVRNMTMEFELALANKIKSISKPFLIIRTCMDSSFQNIVGDAELNEIKDGIKKHMSCGWKEIFLVSNHDTSKWDFPQLWRAIMSMSREIERMNDMKKQYMDDLAKYLSKNGVLGIAEFIKKRFQEWKEVELHFGITGETGCGKSSFINAMLGLDDDACGAAKVDVKETTVEPEKYVHPGNPKIFLWDLPGVGGKFYPDMRTYTRGIDLKKYDIFLILTATRFKSNDLELAKEIKNMKKSFFLVRTKIDMDQMAEKRNKKTKFSEEAMLKKIRDDCKENVKDLISSENEIFLISNWFRDEWDFNSLLGAILDALPVIQRECLILSLSNVTRHSLKIKARWLRAQAVAVATISAATGAISIPGVGATIDSALILGTVKGYFKQLGLSDKTSAQLEKYSDILNRYSFQSVLELLFKLGCEELGALAVGEAAKFIPFIGIGIAGSISFGFTLRYLLRCINDLERVALAVWDKATDQPN